MFAISIDQLRKKLKQNAIVLWPYIHGGNTSVEDGSILFVDGDRVDLIWLEGYKSRNNTVNILDILAINEKGAPTILIAGFSGEGYLTEAGIKWLETEHSALT